MDYILLGFTAALFGAVIGSLATLAAYRWVNETRARKTLLEQYPEAEQIL